MKSRAALENKNESRVIDFCVVSKWAALLVEDVKVDVSRTALSLWC